MKPRLFILAAGLIACAATTAGAQAPASPAVHELAPVIVTPQRGTLYRIAHIEEQRRHVLQLMEQNRRLSADLRRADTKVAQLEDRLVEAKADRARRVADIAAVDSAAAETRRTRLELEAKLKRLESAPSAPRNDNGSR